MSHKNEPYTANCAIQVFWGISRKLTEKFSFWSKLPISERSSELLRKLFVLNMFDKGHILRKSFIPWKQLFFVKPEKRDVYYQKLFSIHEIATYTWTKLF